MHKSSVLSMFFYQAAKMSLKHVRFQKHRFLQWITSYFSKTSVFNMEFTIKKHRVLSCLWKLREFRGCFFTKNVIFTIQSAHYQVHDSNTLFFTMNSACTRPRRKPKLNFFQNIWFLRWPMHRFSKTSVFAVKKNLPKPCSGGCWAGWLVGCLAAWERAGCLTGWGSLLGLWSPSLRGLKQFSRRIVSKVLK